MSDSAAVDLSKRKEESATILVVDDQESIRRTLEGVFGDEGFQVLTASSGEEALEIIKKSRPSLVILDIWMPGIDGLMTLEKIREIDSDLPVVMISGHADIPTAVQATRMGAADFIEKPLDLEATLIAVKKALGIIEGEVGEESSSSDSGQARSSASRDEFFLGKRHDLSDLNPIVFVDQPLKGGKVVQKTLQKSTVLYGHGVHSGKKSGLLLEPLPPNSGIHFAGVSESTLVPAHVDFVDSVGWATTLKFGETQASTVEHLMAALHAYGVSNLMVKCNGEVPVMDGSALEFCNLIEEVGLEEQEGEWFEINIKKCLKIGQKNEYIQVEPAEQFSIDYTLNYPEPIGKQHLVFGLTDPQVFKQQIAPARTFGFVKDIGALQKQGLAQGGRFDNFVLLGEEGAINAELRFTDEPVRHKVLDVMGDLYLLGRRIRGKITASMTGHSQNIKLLKLLREELRKEESITSSRTS